MKPADIDELKLPSLPRAAVRILTLANDPDVEIRELCSAIEHDPGIASRVVQLSNSSLFGISRRVTSVQQAVVVLGLRMVRLSIMGATVSVVLPKSGDVNRLANCWRRILTNASGCRLAARMFQLDEDEAFLAGMMQDIMMLVLANHLGDEYIALLSRGEWDNASPPIHRLEYEAFGSTHAELGGKMLETWSYPPVIIDAVARHHDVDIVKELSEGIRSLPVMMAMVERITEFLLAPTQQHFEAFNKVAQLYGGTRPDGDSQIDQFLQQLELQVEEMAGLLEMKLPAAKSFEQIWQEARKNAQRLSEGVGSGDPIFQRLPKEALLLRLGQEVDQGKALAVVLAGVEPAAKLRKSEGAENADRLVQEAAERISSALRPNDGMFQFDDDTLAILAPAATKDEMTAWIAAIVAGIPHQTVTIRGMAVRSYVVFGGVARLAGSAVDTNGLVEQAAKNLKRARAGMGNCVTEA